MLPSTKPIYLFVALCIILAIALVLNLSWGSVAIPFKDTLAILMGQESEKASWHYIILNYRLPKAIVALLVGMALPISGMLMQTLFRNPIADPYVLGLSSGSSLGVAIVVLGGRFMPSVVQVFIWSAFALNLASIVGSLFVLLIVLLVLRKVGETMTLLVIGLMFSSFAGALVSILAYFSSAEELQKFTFWAMGSLGNLSWSHVLLMSGAIFIGLLLSIVTLKSLDALLLGENYAKSLGVSLRKNRYLIILSTALLAGTATAFAGPIAFIGLAIPHFTRRLFRTSTHRVLFVGNLLLGSILMLLSDTVSQLPGSSYVLPINAITSLIGAPVVVHILLKRRNF